MDGLLIRDKSVTAVVISNGLDAGYLTETLNSLAKQTKLPNRIFVAVPQITEPLKLLCAQMQQQLQIVVYPVAVGDTANLATSLHVLEQKLDSGFANGIQDSYKYGWLWILHADSAPLSDALAQLLACGESSNTVAVVGSKQVTWDANSDGAYDVVEVGIRATRTARRVPEIDIAERDQGQYDNREDLLAVGTAGMLVRADVYQQLDGLSPHLGPFGDGLEFSRRVRAVGYRVVIVPDAKVRHVRNSYIKNIADSFGARRSAQLFNSLVATASWSLIWFWLGYVLIALPRALGYLLLRDYVRARGELKAGWDTFVGLGKIFSQRRKISHSATAKNGLRRLEATASEVRYAKRDMRKARLEAQRMENLPDQLTQEKLARLRRQTYRGVWLTLFVSLIFMAVVNLPYFASGTLMGGQLLTDNSTFEELNQHLWHSWSLRGDGSLTLVDALWILYLPVLFVGAPFGLTLGGAVTLTLYLSVPIAALFAYLAAGRFTKSWVARFAVAMLWIISPSFLEAIAGGRLGAIIVHIFLPLLLWAYVGAWKRKSGQIGLTALVLAILSAAAPIFLLLALVLVSVALVAQIGRFSWLWLPLPAVVLLAPTLALLEGEEWVAFLFSTPGKLVSGVNDPQQILFGFSTLSFDLNSWHLGMFLCLAIILLLALVSLFRSRGAYTIRLGWLVAIFGMLLALLSPYIFNGYYVDSTALIGSVAWHGIGLSIFWLGLFIAIAQGVDGFTDSLRNKSFGVSQFLGITVMVLLPLAVTGLAGGWIAVQLTEDNQVLRGEPTQILPAIAKNNIEAPIRSRVLALYAKSDGYGAEVWRDAGLQLHEVTMLRNIRGGAKDPATKHLQQAVADLLVSSDTAASRLAEHAISVVLLPPATEKDSVLQRDKLISALHSAPNLEYVTTNETGSFWRVAGTDVTTSRVRTITDDNVIKVVESGKYRVRAQLNSDKEQRLVLAERVDSGWKAKVSGKKLKAQKSDWSQTWIIPANSRGELVIYHENYLYVAFYFLQILVGIISVLVSLPLRSVKVGAK